MGVVDWRAWVAQSGGTLPTAPNPPGTPWQNGQMFPGIGPIGVGAIPGPPGKSDLIDGAQSFPTYSNTPVTIKPIDPFYVGTYPNGGGWQAQMERSTHPAGAANNPGNGPTVPAGPVIRPVVAGITS
jgi:hypothetical protein